MKKIFLIMAIFFPLLAFSEESDEWRGIVTIEQSIPSYLSIDDARLMGIKRLQLNAATNAGAVVIRTEKLNGDDYSEIIEVVGASSVKLENLEERLVADKNTSTLILSANATVDLSMLSERLGYIRENNQLREALSELSSRYLASLNNPLSRVPYPLFWEHETIVSRWLSEDEFRGLSDQHKAALLRAERHLAKHVFGPLFEGSELSASIESIARDNDVYIVSVSVNYDFDDEEVNEALSLFWDTRNRHGSSHPFVLVNGASTQKDILSKRGIDYLFRFLSSDVIAIEASVGGVSKMIPVAYKGNGFRAGCNVTIPQLDSTAFCITKISSNTDDPLNTNYFQNPITLVVPASRIDELNGEMVSVRLVKLNNEEIFPFGPDLSLESHH